LAQSWPAPIEVFEHYLRSREAFSHLRGSLLGAPRTISRESRFWGKSTDEIDDAFREMRTELDIQITMLLIASCEASVRTDFQNRVKRRGKDRVSRRFRALEQQRKAKANKGVRLEDILKVWGDESAGNSARPVGKLLLYRHWVAHGRYWIDKKSGLNDPDPFEVWDIIARFLKSLSDFEALPNQSP
jgi:hypothetical protein